VTQIFCRCLRTCLEIPCVIFWLHPTLFPNNLSFFSLLNLSSSFSLNSFFLNSLHVKEFYSWSRFMLWASCYIPYCNTRSRGKRWRRDIAVLKKWLPASPPSKMLPVWRNSTTLPGLPLKKKVTVRELLYIGRLSWQFVDAGHNNTTRWTDDMTVVMETEFFNSSTTRKNWQPW
jgi:hypothetical protein